jgi:acyl dehydratase
MQKGKSISQIETGESCECSFRVTADRVRKFADATGDHNPLHTDEDFARRSIFKRPVAHGMLSAGLVSGVLGTRFPGIGTIYLSQSMQFRRPVFIGDELTVRLTVLEKISAKNQIRIETLCVNQEGKAVLTGEALVIPPS